MPEIIVIAHNIRSTHNVGSIFRTCEGFGVKKLILSGYTPYPTITRSNLATRLDLVAATARDERLPHIAEKLTSQIHKTALGAETMVSFEHQSEPDIASLKAEGFRIVGLEQSKRSIPLQSFEPPDKIALLLGEEVSGIENDLLKQCDDIIEIPMHGEKESFNVSVAAGIALYGLTI